MAGTSSAMTMLRELNKKAPPGGGKTGQGLMSDYTARASLIEMARRTSSREL
jgi:hypothetical protein